MYNKEFKMKLKDWVIIAGIIWAVSLVAFVACSN